MTPVALVTGGSRGIGAAIVDALQGDGWTVLAPTRDELDLSNPISIEEFVQSTPVDIDGLVLNAGINVPGGLSELRSEDWNATHQVNQVAAFQLVNALVPGMAQRGSGRVVAVTSSYTDRARAGRAAYSASKSALESLMRAITVEFGPQGVVANSVAPGFVDTELTRRNNSEEMIDKLLERVPVGRLAEPAEIATAVAFLLSPNNRYVSGETLRVDGGFSCT